VIRALLSTISFVAATLIGALLAVLCGIFDRSGDSVLALARLWSRILLGVPGVKVEVTMRARLEPGRPYVFVANHASMVDIWAVFVTIPASFRFIAKKQLARIPLFGWAMTAGRFIFIDRQNPLAARRSIDEAARRIRSGQSVVIFPEGTRTRTGRLLPFKKGGFHLAIDSGAAIVPVAIRGSHAAMPRGSALIRAGTVAVEVDEPIPTTGMTTADRDALIEKVRGRIAAMLGEPIEAPDAAAR
jgi:1-acyl-sn-glycerol-3-phosphate acyltransferase